MISQYNGIIILVTIVGFVILGSITSYQNVILFEKSNSVDDQLEKLNMINERLEILEQKDREIKNLIRVLDKDFDWLLDKYFEGVERKDWSRPDIPDDEILESGV